MAATRGFCHKKLGAICKFPELNVNPVKKFA